MRKEPLSARAFFLREDMRSEISKQKAGLQIGMRIAECLAAAVFGVLVLERCCLIGMDAVFQWMTEKNGLFWAAVIALLSVYALIRVFFKSPLIPFFLYGSILCLIGAANFYKLFYRNEPFLPYDLFNAGPALAIAGRMEMHMDSGIVLNVLFFLACLVIFVLAARYLYKPVPIRPLGKILSVLCLSAAGLACVANSAVLTALGGENIHYNQLMNYKSNGFTIASLMNLPTGGIRKPAGYSAAAVAALRQDIESAGMPAPLGNPAKEPHLIVLQMEAYADPMLLKPGIHYQIDPFAPLDEYANEIQRFHTLISVMGGGTSNTEYEFLTGYNMFFCPPGVIPFINYVNQPQLSLATDLAAMGYQAIAMHPHSGNFYSRQLVYPRLGFSRLVTQEEFDKPQYVGYYISDKSFGEKVIQLYEEEHQQGPLFLFAISIQNHGPYTHPVEPRFYPDSSEEGPPLNEAQIKELESYATNIYDSSVMLAELIRYFSRVDEPVLLLAFGDHQAVWSWASDLEEGPELERKRYSTESFFWANYPLEEDTRPLINASGLGAQMMRKAGLSLPLYERGIDGQSGELMAYNIALIVENNGSMHYAEKDRLEPFRLLQYDRMFGNRYLEKGQ